MPGWRVSRRPVSAKPWTTLNTPSGTPASVMISASFDGGERRQLGRLEDHGVAAGERRRRLPAGDLERVVPGADAGDDAERLAPRIAEGGRAEIDVLAGERRGEAGEILEAVGAGEHVDGEVSWIGLPVSRISRRASSSLRCAQEVGDAPAGCGRAPRRSSPPRSACAGFGGRDGLLDLGLAGDLDLGEHLAGRRVDGREGLAASRRRSGRRCGCGRGAQRLVPRRCRRGACAGERASCASTKAVASGAGAWRCRVSLSPDRVARSHSPSIIARRAPMAIGPRLARPARAACSAWRRFESMRR